MLIKTGGKLKPAHEGYLYQDLVTAYILSESLVHRYRSVTADKKVVANDRIDDVEIIHAGGCVRRQIKSSVNLARHLGEQDFNGKNSSLRIDRLVQSYVQAGDNAADEYRLCATWSTPNDDKFLSFIEPADVSSTVPGYPSRQFRFSGDSIWPENAKPVWRWLEDDSFNREDFLAFCERFVIELELPHASNKLFAPGPLEQALLDILNTRVGIGRYPNQNRSTADVAALLLAIATLARAQEATLTPEEVESELNLRTDYGRVAQNFPLDEKVFHDRQTLRPVLCDIALKGKHQIVTGPPGAGKSWELTKLTDELKKKGVLVARHYCYLEPGDELVERRITADVFFGNLMAELTDAVPALRSKIKQRYSAGLEELEDLLSQAVRLNKPVVLIVDGVDHIARVLSEARSISHEEAGIIDQLATLEIPPGVNLIVGSQPGAHLDPFRQAFGGNLEEIEIPPWSASEITALAHYLGVESALTCAKEHNVQSILKMLSERSEGNPLYATYLSRGLTDGLELGVITDATEWLQDAPIIDGDIAVYYAYLYQHASKITQDIADVLGVIDFGISEADLCEIVGPLRQDWIPEALNELSSILTAISSQGGVRIFHESFRRFIREELAQRGRSVENVLDPVIRWLQKRGFFQDAKAYRFLLPALQRAGRTDGALALVDASFVSKSVTQGHTHDAVERNLAIALDIAARDLRWPELVRCIELSRSAHTCFEEKLHDPEKYWQAYLDLFGPEALTERLLFDGQRTQETQLGLLLCSMVEDVGGTPPWREYLDEESDLSDDDNADTSMRRDRTRDERVSLMRLQGRMRLGEFDQIKEMILNFLVEHGEHSARPTYMRMLSKVVAQNVGAEEVETLITQGTDSKQIAPSVLALLRLGLADALTESMVYTEAAKAAEVAVNDIGSAEFAVVCLNYGTTPSKAAVHAVSPATLDLGLNSYLHEEQAEQIRIWVASVRLLANTDPEILEAEYTRLEGTGWYRCWLRFVIALAQVEAAKRRGDTSPNISTAVKELAADVRPFAGDPRACDLYQIEGIIQETLEWGFSLLDSEEEWTEMLDGLCVVLDGVSTTLQRGPSGPIYTESVLEALLPYTKQPNLAPLIRSFAEARVADDEASGTYFEHHAAQSMVLARILTAVGETAVAQVVWERVGVYLGGYGFRKDITLYEILDSAPALMRVSRDAVLEALIAAQPLVEIVRRHTDGRSTSRMALGWFECLLKCDTSAGLALLAQSIGRQDATDGWLLSDAVHEALKATSHTADPILLEALYASLPFEIEYEGDSERRADERLAVISRLLQQNSEYAKQAFQRLAGQIEGDGRKYTEGAKRRMIAFADEQGIPIRRFCAREPTVSQSNRHNSFTPEQDILDLIEGNIIEAHFPVDANPVELVAGIRRSGSYWKLEGSGRESFINAFGYRLINLIDEGREEEAIRLIRFYARTYSARDGIIHPLADVGQGLERYGYHRAAAIAYGLAYVKTHGGGGWLSMGGDEHEQTLLRGIELGRNEVLETVANEIAYNLRNISYNAGTSRHLIDRMAAWGEPEVARKCWWAASEVIKHRLPADTNGSGWFEDLRPEQLPSWSVDEGLVAVLLARINHPVLYRKVTALAGIAQAVVSRPDAVSRPLQSFLTRDAATSTILLVLDILLTFETEPYKITSTVADELAIYANGELWGLRVLARILLERIGYSVPSCVRECPDTPGITLSNQRYRTLLSTDVGGRIDRLEKIWPDIPQFIARRLHTLLESSEIHRERGQERYKLAYGNDGKAHPPTPVLYWEQELLETTTHEVLNGLPAHLWATGNPSEINDEEVLVNVLPNAIAHLGVNASRVVRPNYPNPKMVTSGRENVMALQKDSLYTGWRRVAYVENQWVREDNSRYSPPTSRVRVFAGAVAEQPGRTPQSDDFPFVDGDVRHWWVQGAPPPEIPPQLAIGPLMRLTRITDWLGDAFVLVPPIELRSYIALFPPDFGAPLVWRDSDGVPALVSRTWRVRDPEQTWGESLEYEGADLLMRPDIYARMEVLAGTMVRELCVIWEKPIED